MLMSRYFSPPSPSTMWPPEVHEYNESFTNILQNIKKRHDPTVTTVAQGVLEWKRKRRAGPIGQSIQEWLDRFYMSRIGIRFLIGQRESPRRTRHRQYQRWIQICIRELGKVTAYSRDLGVRGRFRAYPRQGKGRMGMGGGAEYQGGVEGRTRQAGR